MHVYCHYFEHTTITHICNHLKQLKKFNYLLYKNLKKIQSRLLDSEKESRVGIFEEKRGKPLFLEHFFVLITNKLFVNLDVA